MVSKARCAEHSRNSIGFKGLTRHGRTPRGITSGNKTLDRQQKERPQTKAQTCLTADTPGTDLVVLARELRKAAAGSHSPIPFLVRLLNRNIITGG